MIGVVGRAGFDDGFGEEGATGEAKLRAPLGGRAVYDANDGSRMFQSGPSPGCPPCPERPGPDTPLENAIEEREQYGMNVDSAYVQSLRANDLTFTEHERRWIKSLGCISYQSKVDDYVQHWREDWGGTSVIARYPARPYLLVRLLRRQSFHEQRMKRLSEYPDLLRTEISTIQRDYFYELPQNIGDDAGAIDGFLDGYGRSGFYARRIRAVSARELVRTPPTDCVPRGSASRRGRPSSGNTRSEGRRSAA